MPISGAGYTYAVEPAAVDRLLANEGESIYGHSSYFWELVLSANTVEKLDKNGELFFCRNPKHSKLLTALTM
jgi:hypothetical protein